MNATLKARSRRALRPNASVRGRAVFAFAALVLLAACTTWKPYTLTPGSQDLPGIVRVTLDSGEQVEIYEPELQGDTLLVGHDNRPLAVSVTRVASLSRIRGIERQATNWAAVVPVAVAGAVGMYFTVRAMAPFFCQVFGPAEWKCD